MGVIIPESDMKFGVYQEEQVFRIEESEQYTKKLRQRYCGTYKMNGTRGFYKEIWKAASFPWLFCY